MLEISESTAPNPRYGVATVDKGYTVLVTDSPQAAAIIIMRYGQGEYYYYDRVWAN